MAISDVVVGQLFLVLGLSVVVAKLARRVGVPEVLALLVAGYVFGPDALNWFNPAALGLTLDSLAFAAIPVILFYEGLRIDARTMRERWKTALSMATLAVLVSIAGVAVIAHFALGFPWLAALLLGSILASTDPASVLPMLRKLNVAPKISTLLEAETAFNDATTIALFLVWSAAGAQATDLSTVFTQVAQIGISSVAMGLAAAFLATQIMRSLQLQREALFASLAVVLAAFGAAQAFGGSGVIAVAVAAFAFTGTLHDKMVDSLSRIYVLKSWNDLNFLAMALVFLVLGAQIQLAVTGPYIALGVAIAIAFLVVVRPITVIIATAFDQSYSLKEKLFVSWIGGPRGAVSAALAAVVLANPTAGVSAQAPAIFSITLVVIVTTVLLCVSFGKLAAHLLLETRERTHEDDYRKLSVELRAMSIAQTKLAEDFDRGLISQALYKQIQGNHADLMRSVERKLAAFVKTHPAVEFTERATRVRELITVQIDAVEAAFDRKEIREEDRNDLIDKYNLLLSRIEELETTKR